MAMNPFDFVKDINYKKKKDLSSTLSFDGRLLENKKIIFEKISYLENQNSINLLNLQLTNNYKIIDLDNLKLEYLNNDKSSNRHPIRMSLMGRASLNPTRSQLQSVTSLDASSG